MKISKSGNMHEAASFTVPEKHRVKFFIGEMQIIRPDKRKRYSENGLQPEGKKSTGCSFLIVFSVSE